MSHPTFATPDLTTFCRLDELGLEAVGQYLDAKRAVLECRVIAPDAWCRSCGAEGAPLSADSPRPTRDQCLCPDDV